MPRIRVLRIVASGAVAGALLVASAFAAVVVDPLDRAADRAATGPTVDQAPTSGGPVVGTGAAPGAPHAGPPGDVELTPDEIAAAAASQPAVPSLPKGERFLVGGARASLSPAPERFGGDHWETEDCTAIDDGNLEADHVVPSLTDLRGWPAASPDCIYLGGFGIGPARVAKSVDDGGVWVRALAVSNGTRTFVYAVADTVGWFARYDAGVCSDCGVLDVRERLAGDLGLDLDDVVVGSTHTHAGADTYGGWGGIPGWYRNQLRDAALAASKQAVANLEPVELAVGEVHVRDRNGQRRDTYWSTADTGATWLQARASHGGRVVATWATYAGHPTVVGGPVLHADWPGAAARRFEASHPGSVGVLFEGGLGNVSISTTGPDCDAEGLDDDACDDARAEATGAALADAVLADVGRAPVALTDNTLRASVAGVVHPATTNPGLTTLATVGLFDREFTPGTKGAGPPGTYHWSKHSQPDHPAYANGCDSAGPTVITTAGIHTIGDFAVAFAPGEIFSNIAEVVKEEADAPAVTMVLGQANDALGYIIQSFEFDEAANVVTQYATETHEYEEVFSIDRCFGDHVLDTLLTASRALGL